MCLVACGFHLGKIPSLLSAAGQMEWYLGQGLVHSRCSSVLMALLEPRGVPPPLGLGSYLFTFLRYLHFSSVK